MDGIFISNLSCTTWRIRIEKCSKDKILVAFEYLKRNVPNKLFFKFEGGKKKNVEKKNVKNTYEFDSFSDCVAQF